MKSFEEFKTLADNPPHPEIETIFALEEVTIDDLPEGKRRRYPRFSVSVSSRAYFHTLSDAENFIKERVEKSKESYINIYCFYLRELALGKEYRRSPSFSVSCRLYNPQGELIDRTYCSFNNERYYCAFRGRDEYKCRFKDGDFAEIYDPYDGQVTLGIISSLQYAPTQEECWQTWQQERDNLRKKYKEKGLQCEPSDFEIADQYFWDWYDDAHEVITGFETGRNGFIIENICLLPPRYKIPQATQNRLLRLYRQRKQ